MTRNKILSSLLTFAMLLSILPANVFAEFDDRTHRSVYVHAQGELPDGTNSSTVYLGENADVYFAVDYRKKS